MGVTMESLAFTVAALHHEAEGVQPVRWVKPGFSLQSALYCFMAALVVIVGGLSVAGAVVSASPPQSAVVSSNQQ